jgi:hypothetical protein
LVWWEHGIESVLDRGQPVVVGKLEPFAAEQWVMQAHLVGVGSSSGAGLA